MDIDTKGFNLGDEVRDTISGFTGRIIGFTQWISGCAVAAVQPNVAADGKYPDNVGFDVTRIVKIGPPPAKTPQRATGGPQPPAPTAY